MTPFAFVIHPMSVRDLAIQYPIARFFPDALSGLILERKAPKIMSHITGIRSITGATTEGWFVVCPLTPKMMTEKFPLEFVYDRIVQCTEIAHREGAKLIGLGAFTSVVGDGGITVESRSPIPVTTGNSYTVATAIEGAERAAQQVGIELDRATLAVVGATGSIGKTCAVLLAPKFSNTVLIGRDLDRTAAIAATLERAEATTSTDALRNADVIITVTSSDAAVIQPEHLKPGCVVCDVARPRDVSVRVAKERPDVLVIEGGVVAVPGEVDFGLDFGFPKKTAYACMSETIMLALEDRAESFTLGKDVSVDQVEQTQRMAAKHGFELAGFRSFERAVDETAIERARMARNRSLSAKS